MLLPRPSYNTMLAATPAFSDSLRRLRDGRDFIHFSEIAPGQSGAFAANKDGQQP
jgi:hypothetical protein